MIRGMSILSICATSLLFAAPAFARDRITFESMLDDMTNLERLAHAPKPTYITRQFSSYDRKSTDPTVLTDDNWFANNDRGQFIRTEDRNGQTEYVMMDTDGPGAIVRFWSANPKDAGIVRIYLDGAQEPSIEMPLQELLAGEHAPFLKPIACELSRGWNSYLPIPYAKHCKVTASAVKFYYHITYRTYPADTKVQTFPIKLKAKQEKLVEQTAARLDRPDQMPIPQAPRTYTYAAEIGAGADLAGAAEGKSRAIYAFVMKVDAKNLEEALRGCLLEINFDGSSIPQVQAPLGDFFGTAPGINKYKSLPSGVLDDGRLYSYWVMPFKKMANFKITNTTLHPVAVSIEVVTGQYQWGDNSLYFHAKWRSEYPIKTKPRQDWNFITAQSDGRFVGDMLHVTNPVRKWWGEGDEKIYVDGEKFPSHFGTGSEDYFGYAWCSNQLFTHAYHNQARCDGPDNYGQTCVSRFHIVDDIPFTSSFKFDIEVWHWSECEIAMAATSYWYAKPNGTDGFAPINVAQLKIIAPPPLPVEQTPPSK